MRAFLWFILIVIGSGAVIYSAVTQGAGAGVATGVLVLFAWMGVGGLQGHFFGLRRRLKGHLGGVDWRHVQIVSRVIPPTERANYQLALDEIRRGEDRAAKPVYGTSAAATGLSAIVKNNPEPAPIEWEQFPSGLDTNVPCATNAIYLLRQGGRPYCALIRPREGRGGGWRGSRYAGDKIELEIAAASRQEAEAALAEVRDVALRLSVYRGEVVSIEKPEDGGEPFTIKFHDMPKAPRERIILPDDVMRVVERNVLGLLEHRETLRKAGRGTRHGVLFHGPPGTGKTLVTRYLAKACRHYTVILLNARNGRFVRESCRLARLMAPSMIILEDVDLIAAERSKNRHATLLHALMDEMDGLGSKSDCIFLLTTNRPDILEPALAARPGRVDQAIYFPLPDSACRRRLVELFANGLDLSSVDVDALVHRTDGASPAFLEELFRKAALLAAERGERSTPLRLTDADFHQSIRELLEFGGDLTRSLLGYADENKPGPRKA